MLLSLAKYAQFWRFNETLFAPLAAVLGRHAAAVRAGRPADAGAGPRPRLAAHRAGGRGHGRRRRPRCCSRPNVLPWYALWLLPLLVLRDEPAALLFTGTVCLAYLVYPGLAVGRAVEARLGLARARVRAVRARGGAVGRQWSDSARA